MTRFTGTFVITTEAKYKFEIEAETQESALYRFFVNFGVNDENSKQKNHYFTK